jgi:hypothetical protein
MIQSPIILGTVDFSLANFISVHKVKTNINLTLSYSLWSLRSFQVPRNLQAIFHD